MKGIYLVTILLFITIQAFTQDRDSIFKKKAVTALDVQLFYSMYLQEGTHSAVTGGEGDEHLTVNHIGTNISQTSNASTIIFNVSLDVITSPSTDKIDFIKSSASEHDNHVQAKVGYQYKHKKSKSTFGAAWLFGIESDYLSNGIDLWFSKINKNKDREFGINASLLFDDLRWGRLSNRQNNKPTTLIYPSELRHTKWIDIFHRHSYNLNVHLRQDINRKTSLKFSVGASYQEGVLSTPFHRVYFSDTTAAKIELLPSQRIRLPMSIALNYFVHRNCVLKTNYRIYWDNFGIFAHTLNLQAALKTSSKFSFYPFFRAHYQSASPYFKPYKEHLYAAKFHTSDYDYSAFGLFKGGIGIGWFPDARLGKKSKLYFNNFMLRYSFFYRTDGLSAHIISLQFGIKK